MSYAPATLTALAAYWASKGGVPLGVVGDVRHTHGYHLGDDRLERGDYSILTARDRAGLTNAASAIDLGRLDRSLENLYAFMSWLVEHCRARKPGSEDVREIIYSPDGTIVLRWDRERGASSMPRPGEADASHTTHGHISFYRDSEHRDKVPLFAPYFEEASAVAGDYVIYPTAKDGQPKAETVMFRDWEMTSRIGAMTTRPSRVEVRGYRGDAYAIRVKTGQPYSDGVARITNLFVPRASVSDIRDLPDPTPYTQADLDAAYARGKAEGDTKHQVTLQIDGAPVSTTEV